MGVGVCEKLSALRPSLEVLYTLGKQGWGWQSDWKTLPGQTGTSGTQPRGAPLGLCPASPGHQGISGDLGVWSSQSVSCRLETQPPPPPRPVATMSCDTRQHASE